MKPEPLIAAFAKIDRAKTQIEEIQKRVEAWVQSGPYHIVKQVNPHDPGEIILSFKFDRLPDELAVIIGETAHNIRSPLDQILSAIAEQHQGTSDGVAFPFGKTADIFERALAKQKKLLPTDTVDMIAKLEPYPRGNGAAGNDLLWSINELNRGDKHRPKLVPIGDNHTWKTAFLAVEKGGMALIIGDRAGGHLRVGDYVPSSRPPSADDELEFMTVRPNTTFHTDMRPLMNVAFKDIGPIKGEPVVAVLHQMRELVERTLLSFVSPFCGKTLSELQLAP